MGDGLEVQPRVEAVLVKRAASSDCCGAKLAIRPEGFTCRRCGRRCGRVLGPPEEVTAHG